MADDDRAGTRADDVPAAGARLEVGHVVEVRSGFDDSWQTGFCVAEVTPTGYRLRRDSDGSLLPEVARDQVRRVRRRQTWWI